VEPANAPTRAAASQGEAAARATPIDGVVTYHLNPYASGVVRFNELLAETLGVPFVGLRDARVAQFERPLLSFKVGEMDEADRNLLAEQLERPDWLFDVYLHDWSGLPLEVRLVERAQRVWCGNHEIEDQVSSTRPDLETVWTPGLLMDRRAFQPVEISVFSFGMAHKIQTDQFRRLRALLEASERSYALYVSSATHETKSIGDAQALYDEMSEIFPRNLYFMGNLSDVAVYNHLGRATFFASFFPSGVRANNTSISGAMEQGAVVITNLDEYSPPHLRHMENLIDIGRCTSLPFDPLVLKRISLRAMEAGRERSWDALAARMAVDDREGPAQ
jgi:hypothetical protein